MTLAALARSVFAVGFSGRSVDDVDLDALRAFGPGAVVLFSRNVGTPNELRALVAALRALDDPPPLVAVDQEGGRVTRLGLPFVQPLPSAMALGAADDPALCERLGRRLGGELAALGVSVDFAPVADLALEPANTVVGTRAFGDDPGRVAALVGAFARGLEHGGAAATLKHFPGHGATVVDSHLALPRIIASAETLRERDLVPFARTLAAGAASLVMLGHLVVEAFDDGRPASLSPNVYRLLREELGFTGVACTDCLEMGAIAAGIGTVGAAPAALEAGADLLLVSHQLAVATAGAEAVAAFAARGARESARLAQAAARVGALRARFATPGHDDKFAVEEPLAAACRSITDLRGELRLRPERPVSVVSFEGASFDGVAEAHAEGPSLSAALRARRWKSELMRVGLDPAPDDVGLLLDELNALGDRNLVLVVRRAHLHPLQYGAVARVLARFPTALVLVACEPYDALLWPDARNLACSYGDDELAFAACADVLSGRATAGGRLPIALDAPV